MSESGPIRPKLMTYTNRRQSDLKARIADYAFFGCRQFRFRPELPIGHCWQAGLPSTGEAEAQAVAIGCELAGEDRVR